MKHNISTAGIFFRRILKTITVTFVAAVAAFCLTAVLSSCTQFYEAICQTETITILVDEADSGTLLWIDAEGFVRREPLTEHNTAMPVTLSVAKGLVTPVLLYGGSQNAGQNNGVMRPKGFVHPFSAELSDKGGFAAHILYRLINESDGDKREAQLYCGHFNWQKFLQCLEKLDDPWSYDQEIILKNIADGTFTMRTLKARQ